MRPKKRISLYLLTKMRDYTRQKSFYLANKNHAFVVIARLHLSGLDTLRLKKQDHQNKEVKK